jgi:hypothetical protein
MAQHRSLPRREDHGHPSSASTDPTRADDVDAQEDFVQVPSLKATRDRPSTESKREQLPPRHDAVLAPSEFRQRHVLLASR